MGQHVADDMQRLPYLSIPSILSSFFLSFAMTDGCYGYGVAAIWFLCCKMRGWDRT